MVMVPSLAVVFRAGIFGFALAPLGGEDTSDTSSVSRVSFLLGDVQVATVAVEITVVAGSTFPRLRFLESV